MPIARLVSEWTHIDTPRGHPARNDAEFGFMMKWLLLVFVVALVAVAVGLMVTLLLS
jgi:hypothetical protein